MSPSLIRPRLEYYAWRHLPFSQFQDLDTLIRIFDTLNRIPNEVTEPHVARMKLAFFQTDINNAINGQATHPDVQKLAVLVKTHALNLAPFHDLCTAIETEIDRVQSIDENDFHRYCKRKYGSFLLICGQLLKKSPLTESEKSSLENLGVFIERVRLLDKDHAEIMHLFPLKEVDQQQYIDQTRALLGRKPPSPALKPIYVLARLYDAKLTYIEKSSSISPITLLALSIFYRIKGY